MVATRPSRLRELGAVPVRSTGRTRKGASISRSLPPIQPDTSKFVVGQTTARSVVGRHHAADFEGVRGGHGAFRAQAAAFRRCLRGVVRQDPPGMSTQMLGFPVARSTFERSASCPACQARPTCLGGMRASPVSTPMRRAVDGLSNLHELARDRLRDPSPWFRAGRLCGDTRFIPRGRRPLLQGSDAFRPATSISGTVATSY